MTRTERYGGGLTGLTGLLFITTFPSIEKEKRQISENQEVQRKPFNGTF